MDPYSQPAYDCYTSASYNVQASVTNYTGGNVQHNFIGVPPPKYTTYATFVPTFCPSVPPPPIYSNTASSNNAFTTSSTISGSCFPDQYCHSSGVNAYNSQYMSSNYGDNLCSRSVVNSNESEDLNKNYGCDRVQNHSLASRDRSFFRRESSVNCLRNRELYKDYTRNRCKRNSYDDYDRNLRRSEHQRRRSRERREDRYNKEENSRRKYCGSRRSNSPELKSRSQCNFKDVDESVQLLEKQMLMPVDEILKLEREIWTRSAPAELYYQRDEKNPKLMRATKALYNLCDVFESSILMKYNTNSSDTAPYVRYDIISQKNLDNPGTENGDKLSEAWMKYRSTIAAGRLHEDLWENRPGELNDGLNCRCPKEYRNIGIRHGHFPGQQGPEPELDPITNNSDKLFHYRVTISPPTNFLLKDPTFIHHDGHDFIFEGFSLFTTEPLGDWPYCKVVRFNIMYTILYFEESFPENITLRELKLFKSYFFDKIMDLVDFDTKGRYFFMPRFVRELPENGKEILSMNLIMSYLIKSFVPIVNDDNPNGLADLLAMPQDEWNSFVDEIKGMLLTKPDTLPPSIRADQLDRDQEIETYPLIIHFGTRPLRFRYMDNPAYAKAWNERTKYAHLLSMLPNPTFKQRRDLEEKEKFLQQLRSESRLKRELTVEISCKGFFKTGIKTDMVQHGLLLPVLIHHLRFHSSLNILEAKLDYKFNDRYLLQMAMTHASYHENFGTTSDHIRNTLSNCGMRQLAYGDKKVTVDGIRKHGINMLVRIMSRFGQADETVSNISHNERLEFLGDAVVEFITSVHLFHMFPDLEEGGLATYRAVVVQNLHLAQLSGKLDLESFMLLSHDPDMCEGHCLSHANANCFEALLGAVFLDSGIIEADRIFTLAYFPAHEDRRLHESWTQLSPHALQMEEPSGDRHYIASYELLQKLTLFEKSIGVTFNHIRLLARAFTDRSHGFNNLTLGSNQRLEFLGDTILQLVASNYLYRHFPEHHEGHLSLLRSSMVNNKNQAIVCEELGIPIYAKIANPKIKLKMKDKADLLEAFIGALYIDKDLEYCQVLAQVCFFPRLRQFIMNQEWNHPKSKLQQCCLTLRGGSDENTGKNGEPDVPIYKVVDTLGPDDDRRFAVAVYFRGNRLGRAEGKTILEAQMMAAQNALSRSQDLFPHLEFQNKFLERSLKQQRMADMHKNWLNECHRMRKILGMDVDDNDNDEQTEVKAEKLAVQENE